MANWANTPPSGNPTRRKWSLEDRTSLNNLKYHIAEEGCCEVQYDLAKQLLERSDDENGSTAASIQAVHWLLLAAQQGHEEASKLLRQCYENDCGITETNSTKVRYCISMTPGEIAARKAARELFACLSNGSEHITPKQLERKMREIYKLQNTRRNRMSPNLKKGDDDKEKISDVPIMNNNVDLRHLPSELDPQEQRNITEEQLVSAAVNYAAGRLPDVNNALTVSVPHPTSLDHVPYFYRMLFHPFIFFTILYHRLIKGISVLPQSVPISVWFAAVILIYSLASNENLHVFLPICFYYICIAIMIWSTCKMLKTKQDFVDFRIWSGLFLSYGNHNIEADISENRFLKNNMKPYLYFFCAFVISLITYPLVRSEWLVQSELTIISCFFVFISLVAFMYSNATDFPDWIVLVSFGINVLAKYPYEMDEVVTTGWRFLDLKVPTFCSFVIGNGIEFCLNCRTALYLLIPGFLVHLAKRSHWNGLYTQLIPHCVTLSWLQVCITTSQGATMFGVVRGTLGLAGLLLFLPLFGIVSVLIPVFVAIEWMGFTDPNIRLGTTVAAAILTLMGSCFLAVNRTTQKYITAFQVIICIIGVSVLTFPYMTSNFKDSAHFGDIMFSSKHTRTSESSDNHLSWHRFYSLCGHPAWENNNKIKTQMRCSHLDGINVEWEGIVAEVKISSVKNSRAEYILKYFPQWLGSLIRCIFGESIVDNFKCDLETGTLCSGIQSILKSAQQEKKCSLHKWNSYEYDIRLKMTAGLLSRSADVVLKAGHKFSNFTQRIVAGDRIHFYGTLLNSRLLPDGTQEDFLLGSSHTQVKLLAVECLLCGDNQITPVRYERNPKSLLDARLQDLMRGIKYLLNVLFNPLITFK